MSRFLARALNMMLSFLDSLSTKTISMNHKDQREAELVAEDIYR